MIPKIIHYCWFGNGKIPSDQITYINEWKRLMPDYQIKCWNEKNFNISAYPFARDAYNEKKFAFVADFVRVWALYNEGGVYMDTDVKVNKSFDEFLKYTLFTSYEYHPKYEHMPKIYSMLDENGFRKKDVPADEKIPGCGLFSALLASEPQTEFMKDLFELYSRLTFAECKEKKYTIPTTLALVAEHFGFRYRNEFQLLKGNFAVFPANVFASYQNETKNSVVVHKCAGSWSSKSSFSSNLKNSLYKRKFLRTIYISLRNMFEKYPIHY
jgi:hypothetical protein